MEFPPTNCNIIVGCQRHTQTNLILNYFHYFRIFLRGDNGDNLPEIIPEISVTIKLIIYVTIILINYTMQWAPAINWTELL